MGLYPSEAACNQTEVYLNSKKIFSAKILDFGLKISACPHF
jgi:hypothetical protein